VNINQIIGKAAELITAGKTQEAEALLRPHLQGFAPSPDLLVMMGTALVMGGKYPEAIPYFEKSYKMRPNDNVLLHNWALAYSSQGKHDEAVEILERLTALSDDDYHSKEALATALVNAGRPEDAVKIGEWLEKAGHLRHAYKVFIMSYESIDKAKMIEYSKRGAEEFPDDHLMCSNYAMNLSYFDGIDEGVRKEAHLSLVKALNLPESKLYRPNVLDPEADPLRVGILSSDFRVSAVNNFMLPLVRALDAQGFSLYFYPTQASFGDVPDIYREYGTWIPKLSPILDKTTERIAQDNIHILLEMNLLTALTVPRVSAARPAPLQISAIGYPGRSYWPWIDARITDKATDVHLEQIEDGEDLVALDRCFLCYDTQREFPELTKRKFDPKRIRFGSFNNPLKLDHSWLDKFAEIVKRTPGSVLVLKHVNLMTEQQQRRLVNYFEKHGIGDRLVFPEVGEMIDWAGHMVAYNEVDIALDSFPYNGTTTTCDCLAMGVPVVAVCGKDHVSRVSYSILNAAGFGEWCTDSPEHFVEHALKMAKQVKSKESIREQFFESEMNDEDSYGRHLGDALKQLWKAKFA